MQRQHSLCFSQNANRSYSNANYSFNGSRRSTSLCLRRRTDYPGSSGEHSAKALELLSSATTCTPEELALTKSTPEGQYELDKALGFAAAVGDVIIMERLIEAGADPTSAGCSPLKLAAGRGHYRVVQRLLMIEGVDASSDNWVALRRACAHGHHRVVQLLLEQPDSADAIANCEPLVLAAGRGHVDLTIFLLENTSMHIDQALCQAASAGHIHIIILILRDNRFSANAGSRALGMAAQSGHINVVESLLLIPGIQADYQDNYAFRWAAAEGRYNIVRLLLKHPNVDATSESNFALRWALRRGHASVVQALLRNTQVYTSVYSTNPQLELEGNSLITLAKARSQLMRDRTQFLHTALALQKSNCPCPSQVLLYMFDDAFNGDSPIDRARDLHRFFASVSLASSRQSSQEDRREEGTGEKVGCTRVVPLESHTIL